MVLATWELEREYGSYGGCDCWDNGDDVEYQCGEGVSDQVSGGGEVLSESMVE